MSQARIRKTIIRKRFSVSRGPPRPKRFHSSSSPLPPPPVGRRSTGGFPPMPGSFRSVSTGYRVKVLGMAGGLCDAQITPTLERMRGKLRWLFFVLSIASSYRTREIRGRVYGSRFLFWLEPSFTGGEDEFYEEFMDAAVGR